MKNAYPRWSFLAVPLLAALGCSDPVPPPAQGAVTLSVHPPSPAVNQTNCPVGGTTYQVGVPDLKNCPNSPTGAPTATCPGGSIISGQKGSSISCSVTGAGGGLFNFSGTLHALTPQGVAVDVSMSATGVSATASTMANVSVLTSPDLQGSGTLSSAACTLSVINSQVKGGSIWASFTCPQVAGAEKQYLCGADGYVVFENCSGS